MNKRLPRVAIPEPTSANAAYNQRSLPQYIQAIESAGGVAVTIPLLASRAVQEDLLACCAAVVLPGSPADVDPARYGAAKHKNCAANDPEREAVDEFLLEEAFQHDKPLLGICYGLQSLNVWRHGTLVQHLPDAAQSSESAVDHDPGRDVTEAHSIHVDEGSRLFAILGSNASARLNVNSSHHQAVARPGEGLRAVATSQDNVIEAIEPSDASKFVIAVQWHPERTYKSSAASGALFAALIKAAEAGSTPLC